MGHLNNQVKKFLELHPELDENGRVHLMCFFSETAIAASMDSSVRNEALVFQAEVEAHRVRQSQVEAEAYKLWEEAGRPECDGVEFWESADCSIPPVKPATLPVVQYF